MTTWVDGETGVSRSGDRVCLVSLSSLLNTRSSRVSGS